MNVFICGSASIKELDENITKRLENMCSNNLKVLLCDNDGTDARLQEFFASKNYESAVIYSMKGENKLNVGNWEVIEVIPSENKPKGFGYYAMRDMEMIKSCDYGFMIWDGKSKEVLYNAIRLAEEKKTNVIYLDKLKKFVTVSSEETLKKLVNICDFKVQAMFKHMTDPLMRKSLF